MRLRVEMVHAVTGERITRWAAPAGAEHVTIYAAPESDDSGTRCTLDGRPVLRGLPGSEHWRLTPESVAAVCAPSWGQS